MSKFWLAQVKNKFNVRISNAVLFHCFCTLIPRVRINNQYLEIPSLVAVQLLYHFYDLSDTNVIVNVIKKYNKKYGNYI